MYVSKKILEIIRDIKGFLGQDNKSVYCMIRQELKYNKKYKKVRFVSEIKFYEYLEIGKYLDENEIYDSQYNNVYAL